MSQLTVWTRCSVLRLRLGIGVEWKIVRKGFGAFGEILGPSLWCSLIPISSLPQLIKRFIPWLSLIDLKNLAVCQIYLLL